MTLFVTVTLQSVAVRLQYPVFNSQLCVLQSLVQTLQSSGRWTDAPQADAGQFGLNLSCLCAVQVWQMQAAKVHILRK